MTWSYRIIQKTRRIPKRIRPTGSMTVKQYDIHEVYYNAKGKITQWTKDPVDANAMDSIKDTRNALAQMLRDSLRYPTLKFYRGKLVEIKERP